MKEIVKEIKRADKFNTIVYFEERAFKKQRRVKNQKKKSI